MCTINGMTFRAPLCVYIYKHTYIHGTEVEILTRTTGMPSAPAGLEVRLFYHPAKTICFLPLFTLSFPQRNIRRYFKSVHLMIFNFFNYIGLNLYDFKLLYVGEYPHTCTPGLFGKSRNSEWFMNLNSFNNVEETQRNAEKIVSMFRHPTHWQYFLVRR